MREAVFRVRVNEYKRSAAKFAAVQVRVKPDLSKGKPARKKRSLLRYMKDFFDLNPED